MALIKISVAAEIAAPVRAITQNLGRALALERANNPLPWRMGALTIGALESLDEALMRACAHEGRQSDMAIAGAFLLQATLVTGRPSTSLMGLKVCDKDPELLRPCDPAGLYRGAKHWAWFLPPGMPSSAQQLKPRERDSYRPTKKKMLLWCGDRTKQLLNLALERNCLQISNDVGGATLQPWPQAWSSRTFRSMTSAFLQTIPTAERLALTPKRIETWLYQTVATQSGDVALASILTGIEGPVSNATLHYTWLSRKQAFEMHYNHVVSHEQLLNRPSVGSDSRGGVVGYPRVSHLQDDESTGYGSRFVPKISVVRKLSHAFRDQLHRPAGGFSTIAELIAFHNAFTLHSVALIGFAAGMRSVADPIPNKSSIDQLSRFVILNDKGDADPLRDRLAWLPDCAFQQIMHYEKHMRALPGAMKALGLAAILKPEQLKATRRDRQAVVLLDPERGVINSPVKDVAKAFRKKGFPIRMNAWRHYFRASLVHQLPADVLHAFLGHWQRGQEPWSNYSCLDPQAYRDALKGPLEALLEADGWEPVPGLHR